MTNKILYVIWAVLFTLCAGLGFLPEPDGLDKGICITLAVLFYVPPAVIVYMGWKKKNWEDIRLVRNLSLGSLAVTLAALVVNMLSLAMPVWAGNLLYAVLVIVSAPMVCGQVWVLSLVLWACLMWSCILLLGKKK